MWEITSFTDLEDAALAILTKHEKPDAVDLIALDEMDLTGLGLRIKATTGDTPVPDLRGTHRDLVSLTYGDLHTVASAVLNSMRSGHFKRIGKREKLRMVTEAVRTGRVDLTALAGDMHALVAQALAQL